MGVLGIILIVGSLLWAMADIWPGENFTFTPALFYIPVIKLCIGLIIALVGMVIVSKFLPKTRLWNGMVLSSAVKKQDRALAVAGKGDDQSSNRLPHIGSVGIATTDLHPSGQVEIDGHRYQASLTVGALRKEKRIEVIAHQDYSLIVKQFQNKD